MVTRVEILFVTTELAPYSARLEAPEIADAAASLPKALRGLGHRVTVVSPLYKSIDPTARSLARRLSVLNLEVLGKNYACQLYDGRTTGGVDLIFIGNAELFGEQAPDHTGNHALGHTDGDAQLRAALLLSAAAAQLACTREPKPDILHVRGAGSAAAIALAKQLRPELACVLSLSDGEDPLAVPTSQEEFALPDALRSALSAGASTLLHVGALRADAVVAASAASQQLFLDSDFALAATLRDKGPRFSSILNGVDASVWNPLIDSHLSARFDVNNLTGKARCKGSLQYMLGLEVNADMPLITFIGELTPARGGDLVAAFAHDCMRHEVQLCVLGSDTPAARKLQALAADLPERLTLRIGHDDKERHLALGGSDFLLLPAREPRSLDIALAGLRYGALPIVRPVGALSDVVIDTDAKLETGNGFLLEETTAEDLLATVRRALTAYARRTAFDALRKRAMRQDVSWERAARRYEHVFKQINQAQQSAASA